MSHHKSPGTGSPVLDMVERAAWVLPEQGPLASFVHHNTLHAFEHLPFEQAVVEASRRFGTEPFMSESAFSAHVESGRITPRDIQDVVAQHAPEPEAVAFPGGPSRAHWLEARLLQYFEVPRGQALNWVLAETDALRSIHPKASPLRKDAIEKSARATFGETQSSLSSLLTAVFESLKRHSPEQRHQTRRVRRRDQLLEHLGIDTDQLVHPLLLRCAGSYLDQGVAYWQLPDQKATFLDAFRQLYGQGFGPPDSWLRGLSKQLKEQQAECWSAARTIEWCLTQLRIPEAQWQLYTEETLLSLRGWAGMFRQFEVHPERAPVRPRPARLADYLAVQLLLDLQAVTRTLADSLGTETSIDVLDPYQEVEVLRPGQELAYESFLCAQLADFALEALLKDDNAQAWLREVRSFDELERRKWLHLAFERRHRVEVLDGAAAHAKLSKRAPSQSRGNTPRFQAVFCIDEREESFRRHLEELLPELETLGAAGFYGVAMQYQGLEDVRPRPLCPVSIQARHLVREVAETNAAADDYRSALKRRGKLSHSLWIGRRTLARGGLISAYLGLTQMIPLVARSVFPRLAEHWSHRMSHAERPKTRLLLKRKEGEGESEALLPGYTVAEMADVVDDMLRTMGISQRLAPLVLIVGHGSSSLNNPHEAAHDCGATGGGRGGPNARAFALMANDPEVRQLLAERGTAIPEATWFVGSYHNTCDDSMSYYDEEQVPHAQQADYERLKNVFKDGCRYNAHERCRRFESAPSDMTLEAALAHAEAHATDLGQPRPEYGHATNAVCVVGRRDLTRGLFMDRRAFLVSYDPSEDPTGERLGALLQSVGPVGAGINLEYYFSFVDSVGYGCGTKLPHNISGLVGVMDGHASDLRTGLPWQMVEIHEPVRMLTIVEARREVLERILQERPSVAELVLNGWIRVVAWEPDDKLYYFEDGAFHEHVPENTAIPIVNRSMDFYRAKRHHLGAARIEASLAGRVQ